MAPPVLIVPAALSKARSQENVPPPERLQTGFWGVMPPLMTRLTSPLASVFGAVSARSAIRRPKLAAPALSCTGRHSAAALWHEGSGGVHAAPAGSPTPGPEQSPPPPLDEDPLLDDEDVLVDDEDPLLDEAAPPAPPLSPEEDDVASPPAPPAEEAEVEAPLDDELEPPLPLLIEDEQPARARVGMVRLMRSAKEDRLFIPGA